MSSEHGFKDDPTMVMHVAIYATLSFLAFLAVILRLWARRIQRNSWDLSDYLIITALVWTLASIMFLIYTNVRGHFGGDATQMDNPQAFRDFVALQLKSRLVGETTWATSVFFIRASVLSLYIRVFRTRSFRIAGYILHGVNAAFFVSVVLAALLICRPIAHSWDPTVSGTCGVQKNLDMYIAVLNLLLDVAVVVLPMPVLWGLQMAVSKKVMLSGMFGLGIIICVLTLVRVKTTSENNGSNAPKVYSELIFYAGLEILLGVINACLPVLKPVFVKLYSSKASTWISSVTSGSIPIFMRISQMGSIRKSSTKRTSTAKQPPAPKITRPWSPSHASPVEMQQTPPPRYADSSPKESRAIVSPAKSPTPSILPQSTIYSPKRDEQHEDNTMPGIRVERSWDVDVERGDSVESDRQVLVRDAKRW